MRKFLMSIPVGVASVVVVMAVLYLTLFPDPLPDNTPSFPGLDKIVHGLMMFGVSGCVAFDYLRSRYGLGKKTPPKGILLIILVSTILFGGAIELLQAWMDQGRSEDLFDFIADSAGAISAFLVELLWWCQLRQWLLSE